jgi:small subunit ribosomal protein S14
MKEGLFWRTWACRSKSEEEVLARKSLVVKAGRPQKFKVREYNRCPICGRSRGYYRKFDMCRICFREMASNGLLPGITKSSW